MTHLAELTRKSAPLGGRVPDEGRPGKQSSKMQQPQWSYWRTPHRDRRAAAVGSHLRRWLPTARRETTGISSLPKWLGCEHCAQADNLHRQTRRGAVTVHFSPQLWGVTKTLPVESARARKFSRRCSTPSLCCCAGKKARASGQAVRENAAWDEERVAGWCLLLSFLDSGSGTAIS